MATFVEERAAEGTSAYERAFAEAVTAMSNLLEASSDLRDLGHGRLFIGTSRLVDAARYTAGPPISRDDLSSLADVPVSFARVDEAGSRRMSLVIEPNIDCERFPWLFEGAPRAATPSERQFAIDATAVVWASQRVATLRRAESSRRQENAVKALLRTEQFDELPRRTIDRIDDLPRGSFCPEAKVAGTKCDVPIRLRNGGLLLIECKVSSSSVNSYKRLNHETGDKAATWGRAFGAQATTMGVLAGVYRLANLVSAQDEKHVFIAWERDLSSLAEFLGAAS